MRDYAMVKTALQKDLARWLPKTFAEDSFSPAQAEAEGWSSDSVAAALQVRSLYKKLAPDGQNLSAVTKTLEKFQKLNAQIGFLPPNSGDSESMTYLMHLFRDSVWDCLDYRVDGTNFDLAFMADHFRSGPGASRNADSRNFYTKMFDSNHSYTTPYVLALFRAACSGSSTWTNALELWSQRFRPVQVRGNSLFTVKKNAEESRTCCTEPLINMLLQQALGAFEELRLSEWGISLDTRPDINRELARIGSIDGSYGTSDLSSASDSTSTALCEWACPPTFFKWLKHFRSEIVRFPGGHEEKLNMISTMGNGFTFPLETIVFASAIRAVYRSKGLVPHFSGKSMNCSIFGDDIIVRKDCFDSVNRLLQRLGYTVNEGKSFNTGSFRESCGFDYWAGRNVRPVFIESLETPQDVYSSFNRLARWSAENKLPLGRTLYALANMARFLPVPFSWADDSGFKVPCSRSPAPRLTGGRFRFMRPISTVQAVPKNPKEAKRLKYKDFNPYGWELCFLGGYARNPGGTFINLVDGAPVSNDRRVDGINRRPFQGEVLPRELRTAFVPYWDWFGAEDRGRFALGSFQYWEVLVEHIF